MIQEIDDVTQSRAWQKYRRDRKAQELRTWSDRILSSYLQNLEQPGLYQPLESSHQDFMAPSLCIQSDASSHNLRMSSRHYMSINTDSRELARRQTR
jgi:hypothetical protein